MILVDPRRLAVLADVLAGQSRDQYATPLYSVIRHTSPVNEVARRFISEMGDRTALVKDVFFLGALAMLKLLHGDGEPESLDGDQPERLREYLNKYGLLAGGESTR